MSDVIKYLQSLHAAQGVSGSCGECGAPTPINLVPGDEETYSIPSRYCEECLPAVNHRHACQRAERAHSAWLEHANIDPERYKAARACAKDMHPHIPFILANAGQLPCGLWFYGPSGSGKTTQMLLAARHAWLMAVRDGQATTHNPSVRYVTMRELMRRSAEADALAERCERVDLLLIDELQPASWWFDRGERLSTLLDARYALCKSTFFASNYTPENLAPPKEGDTDRRRAFQVRPGERPTFEDRDIRRVDAICGGPRGVVLLDEPWRDRQVFEVEDFWARLDARGEDQ